MTHDRFCPPEREWDPSLCRCSFIKAIREDERQRMLRLPRACPTCFGFGRVSA